MIHKGTKDATQRWCEYPREYAIRSDIIHLAEVTQHVTTTRDSRRSNSSINQ